MSDLLQYYSAQSSHDDMLHSIPLHHVNCSENSKISIDITEYYEGDNSTTLLGPSLHITDMKQLDDFMNMLQTTTPNLIYKPKLTLNKLWHHYCCQLPEEVDSLTFHGGLDKVLGFHQKHITSSSATKSPNLNALHTNTDDSLFIYCNLCRDMCVGNVFAPLLRQVVLPPLGEVSRLENIVMDHKIYTSVRSNIINHIEFEIRNNSGEHFTFLPNSVTTLTLHFKRQCNGQ